MSERRFYIAFGIDGDGDAGSFFFSEQRDPVETWVRNGGKRDPQPDKDAGSSTPAATKKKEPKK